MQISIRKTEKILKNLNGFIYSIDYSEEGKQFYISESVEEFTGYPPDEIEKNGGMLSLVYDEDRINLEDFYLEIEEDFSMEKAQLEYRIQTRTDELVWVKEDISVLRNEEDEIIQINGIVTELKSQKEKEENLNNSIQFMKELNSAKDKFISIISHDLRAPFTSLLGFSEILMNEQDLAPRDRNEYLSYIYEASNNQLHLINYLLDWSRLQTGRIQLELQNLNLKNIISSAIASLTGAAMRKNIEIEVDVKNTFEIHADLRLITQVISNLMSNAIKFTYPEKKIFVSATQFKEGLVEIIVKDEGLGITPENQLKLFKIDQKLSTEGTGGEKGTGFGLTLVKEIVEKHGGTIWFYSEPEKGAEFHITIPEAQNVVLLVEDDEPTRLLYHHLIKKALPNYDLVETSNGYEAMSYILKKMPSLVITDHEMPLMSGLHLAEAIRKKDKNSTIPILVISAKLTDELRKKYTHIGVTELVSKPVDSEILIEIIKQTAN